ncbi:MAG TPA: SDR family oxidoreductase [Chloroflexota bacterium]
MRQQLPTPRTHRRIRKHQEAGSVFVPRPLHSAVIVVTGASSGIGRATALAFARRGASIVLAARRAAALRNLAAECERLGGRALAVPTDVTDERAVRALAQRAVETFGRLDVWVNNAGVALFSRFEEAPPEVFRRVIETNLLGYVHGARAALPLFRHQGSGVLINNASVFGGIGAPYWSAYVTTKFGIRGFSACLRQEVRDAPDIHVCTVLPASIDTPLFQHGGNYTGRAIKPVRPVYDAEAVAEAIVRLAERPRREVFVGAAGRLLLLLHTLLPGLAERLIAFWVERDSLQKRTAPPSPGNLFQPMPEWTTVSGGWKAGGALAPRVAVAGLTAIAAILLGRRWLHQRRNPSAARRLLPNRSPTPPSISAFLIGAASAPADDRRRRRQPWPR